MMFWSENVIQPLCNMDVLQDQEHEEDRDGSGRDNICDECSDLGLTLLEATRLAEDRCAWRPAV